MPWWPHYGISFAINKRATEIRCMQDIKPQKLPRIVDDHNKPVAYQCTSEEWDDALGEAKPFTEDDISSSPPFRAAEAYASRLGI